MKYIIYLIYYLKYKKVNRSGSLKKL